ncbi:hypothetical protein [Ferdinandcohnia sp. Marseille-Q9671]
MKWKNYGLYVSLASILYMVFKDLGIQIDLSTWETYVTAVLGILATLGIISNPEKGKGFFDKTPDTPTEAISQVTENLQNQNQPLGQQGNPPQNPNMQNQFYNQQNQWFPPQQTIPNNAQEPGMNQNNYVNQYQNEYQGAPVQGTTDTMQAETVQVQPETSQTYSQPLDSYSPEPQNNSSFDRASIHGMPAPPDERM